MPGTQAPGTQPSDNAQQPASDAFAQAPPSGGESSASALPNMIGDLGFYGTGPRIASVPTTTTTTVTVPGLTLTQINQRFALSPSYPTPGFAGPYFDLITGQRFTAAQLNALAQPTTTSFSSTSSSQQSSSQLSNRVPIASFGAFKVSDNESVQPVDRVFMTYNYFDVDGFHGNSSSINREVIGFEKTFFDGRASFEVRAPFTQVGEGLGGSSDFDSMTFVLKYAPYIDRETGNIICAGVSVTVPTGPSIPVDPTDSINPTLLQPYIGYAFNFGRFYLQGFSEIIVPTDNNLPSFVSNDIGFGYRLQNAPVIPTFEVHINDPLNHQGSLATPFGFVDSVVLTGGLHTLIGNSVLTFALTTPVTGPRLYSVEAIAQLNWRF
jgi:hypothetical protein